MEAVRLALEQASSPTVFEDRINHSYEGEHPLLVRAYNSGQHQYVEGWEDLDDDGQVTDAGDDKLFTLTRGPGGTGTLQGHGANGYFTHAYAPGSSPQGAFWTDFLGANMLSPGWEGYSTAMARRTQIASETQAYRSSPAYATEQEANRAFYAAQRAGNPGFAAAAAGLSSARETYRARVRGGGWRTILRRVRGRGGSGSSRD
jgi:hypothetical protein